MKEKGKVVSVQGGRALVELLPGEGCAHCRLCSPGASGRNMCLEVEAVEGLRPGQEVMIEVDSAAVLKGGAAMFILPLIAFIVGAAAAPDLARIVGLRIGSELASILLGLILLGLVFLGIYLRARKPKYQRKLTPKIVDFG